MIDLSKSSSLLADIQRNSNDELNCFWLGIQEYEPIWFLQKHIHSLRKMGEISDVFLLLEHEHVYTFGKNANHDHLLPTYPEEAEVIQIDRGGDITYHGPGQIVGYPILDLENFFTDIHKYLRLLEETVILTLDSYGIKGERNDGKTGVWLDVNTPFPKKICAMGVRASRWVTMHGFALNVDVDLDYFNNIIPCGLTNNIVTSIKKENKDFEIDINNVKTILKECFSKTFNSESI